MAGTTLPTLPTLTAGYVVQEADMNNLAYCCTFLLAKPIASVKDSAGGQTISSGGTTVISWGTKNFDTDGMYSAGNPTRLTVQTPGWYKVSWCIGGMHGSAAMIHGYLNSTTGSNNPGGSGNVSADNWCNGQQSFSSTGANIGAAGVWPYYLYAGDYIQLTGQNPAAGGATFTTFANESFLSLEYVSLY
jgi:hypothetical protein